MLVVAKGVLIRMVLPTLIVQLLLLPFVDCVSQQPDSDEDSLPLVRASSSCLGKTTERFEETNAYFVSFETKEHKIFFVHKGFKNF